MAEEEEQLRRDGDGAAIAGGLLDPKEIIQSRKAWTLAGDAGLLKYLEKNSDDLLERTALLQKQMDSVILEAKRTSSRFGNVNNQFLGLTNTQFIENRVYDEDVVRNSSSAEQNEVPKSKSEKESEMIASVRAAVAMGTAVLKSHFHKIEIRPQDFDEDDDPSFKPPPIYEPLDPYVNRALPFVIGTVDFQKWDHVGLKEDEEAEPPAKAGLLDVSEEDDTIVVSMSRNEDIRPPPSAARPVDVNPANSDSSGMFGGESEESDDLFSKHSSQEGDLLDTTVSVEPSTQDLLNSELTAKLGITGTSESRPRAAPRKAPVMQSRIEGSDEDNDLFGAPPPLPARELDASSAPVTDTGLFQTRSGGLFDEEEDDIFAGPSTKSLVKSPLPLANVSEKPVTKKKKEDGASEALKNNRQKIQPPGGLFGGEESDDEDDIFSIAVKKKPEKPKDTTSKVSILQTEGLFGTAGRSVSVDSEKKKTEIAPHKQKSSLFGEEDEEEEAVEELGQGEEKPPVFGAVGLFGSAGKSISAEIERKQKETKAHVKSEHRNNLPQVHPDVQFLEDESDEEDLFAVVTKTEGAKKPATARNKKAEPAHSLSEKKPVDLFGSNDEDDFGLPCEKQLEAGKTGQDSQFHEENMPVDSEGTESSGDGSTNEIPVNYPSQENNPVTLEEAGDSQESEWPDGTAQGEENSLKPEPPSLGDILVAGLKKNIETKQEGLRVRSKESTTEGWKVEIEGNDSAEVFSDSFNPLPSLSKTRAKIPSKRRLPSRKGAPGDGDSSDFPGAVQSGTTISRKSDSPPESPPPLSDPHPAEELISPSMEKVRVFDPLSPSPEETVNVNPTEKEDLSTEDIIQPPVDKAAGDRDSGQNLIHNSQQRLSHSKKDTERVGQTPLTLNGDDEKLFASAQTVWKPAKGPLSLNEDDDDDDIDIFEESASEAQQTTKSLFDSDSEDIFGSEPDAATDILPKPESNPMQKKKTETKDQQAKKFENSLFGDDEDSDLDIFK